MSPTESWAVGNVGSQGNANRTLVERFNGSQWSDIASPNEGSSNNGLNSVSMISGAGWAVGYAQTPVYQPLAVRWDGSQWSLGSVAKFSSDALFTGVDTLADRSAWAVGFKTTSNGMRQTLIEQASPNGTLTPVASPNDGASDNTLTAVSGTQATGLWAVGYRMSSAGLVPLILRYDTTKPSPTWVSVTGAGGVPSPGKVETVLTSIDVLTAKNVWAVGYYDNGSAKQPLALHWTGTAWRSVPIAGEGLLRRISASSATDVWATGTYYNATDQRYETLVVHFNGTSWSTVVSDDSASSTDELLGVSADPSGSIISVVGRQGPNALIEQADCTSGPVALPTRTPATFPPVSTAPGVGPTPNPPPPTPPATTPIPVTFSDRATAAGIGGDIDWTFSATVADYNGDSWPDIFVARHWHPANLYLNNQDGTFSATDVNFFKSITDRHDCHAADFNKDGLKDIFCSVGADRGTGVKSNALYIQGPGGSFTDQAYQWNISDAFGRGRYGAVLDANNDGYPDVFYGSESLRPDGMPSMNRFYMNTGKGSFVDDPAMGLDLEIGSLCARTVDYNSDGWKDLLLCGEEGGLHLFRNDQGHGFTDVSSILGTPVKALDAVMADVNHDNRPDLITLTTNQVAERLQQPDGTFGAPKAILTMKSGRALAVGDVNGDNNSDIYVVCGTTGTANAPDVLLLGNATGGFNSTPIPETTAGNGDRAYGINYTKGGLTSFLVLNGQVPHTGPLQLITPESASAASLGKQSRTATSQRGVAP